MVCLHVSKIRLGILRSFRNLCFIACLFSFIENTAPSFRVGFENIDCSCIVH